MQLEDTRAIFIPIAKETEQKSKNVCTSNALFENYAGKQQWLFISPKNSV